MGVLNVTPDSFSDGGDFIDAPRAVARLHEIAAEGAAICDVGAESTRPGSAPVDADEELRRLAPVFAALAPLGVPRAPIGGPASAAMAISIDTSKASVADAALRAGAVLVNDVTAGRGDADLLPLVGERGAAVCLVHMLGEPRTMQEAPRYDDVVDEVRAFLEARLEAAVRAGVREDRVLLDPGIGFGKRLEDNLALLRGLRTLAAIGRPVVVGVSRKSMFGALLGRAVDERAAGSLAAGLLAVDEGAAVLRVHDVRDTADALRVRQALRSGG
jgi:dihydropteroate synthase